jgi:2-oxoglutarate/2-oxoacid ferredoxin oxidoreductase subunit alpha
MRSKTDQKNVIVDGSRIVIEAMARAGADSFIGYPITPANLLYQYAGQRFPLMLPAPDEITTLQWMSGLSACGRIPVTATSFPGFALMIESINMAFMMELPMVIILVQRLGPATGTATCGAQGDIALLKGMISGGHQLPVLCPSDFNDCWNLSARAVSLSAQLRTPVVFLTSKEEMMTRKSFDLVMLDDIKPLKRIFYGGDKPYIPYEPGENLVPEFLPVTSDRWQVRLNASTHNRKGILQHSGEEALANTRRLEEKSLRNLPDYTICDLDEQKGAETLIVSYGISAAAARDAVAVIRESGKKISILITKTILPVPDTCYNIIDSYKKVIFAEENINGQYAKVMFGERLPDRIRTVGEIGRMVGRDLIIKEEAAL